EQMFAFVSCNEEGEGVIALKGSGGWMPMVGADMDRVKSLLPMVVAMGVDFKILKFEGREDITDQFMARCNTSLSVYI
ncbi:unnamed protein product, partial [marine sediment metagenome]